MKSAWDALYGESARERFVAEPAKRVAAPERTPFERDRARVVHSASLRRLAAKTQVLGPQTDDFVRNRLTHSLEVAQVARDLAHPLGVHPDLAETAALAHDLGHPPFGHGGERVLDELAAGCGGFEGNAQSLRILTRLEAKTFHPDGTSAGLNLTRATLDACTKYPWAKPDPTAQRAKFGVYDDDLAVFAWLRAGVSGARRCVEAQIMDIADDIAYSVHDFEDGIVGGRITSDRLDDPAERAAVWATTRAWYLPDADDAELEEAFASLRAVAAWPDPRHGYDGTRAALAGLKNLTSDLIGVFCGAVDSATRAAHGPRPLVRHDGDVVVPGPTWTQITVLKGIAAHYVMQTPERLLQLDRQRTLLAELFEVLIQRGGEALDPEFRAAHDAAVDDAARTRVVVDQIASLTDESAVGWHRRWVER